MPDQNDILLINESELNLLCSFLFNKLKFLQDLKLCCFFYWKNFLIGNKLIITIM